MKIFRSKSQKQVRIYELNCRICTVRATLLLFLLTRYISRRGWMETPRWWGHTIKVYTVHQGHIVFRQDCRTGMTLSLTTCSPSFASHELSTTGSRYHVTKAACDQRVCSNHQQEPSSLCSGLYLSWAGAIFGSHDGHYQLYPLWKWLHLLWVVTQMTICMTCIMYVQYYHFML